MWLFGMFPESSEDGMHMTEFIQHLLNDHTELKEAEAIEIIRAHYTPTTFRIKCHRSKLSLLGMKTRPKKSVYFLFWQLVNTTNPPLLSRRSNLFVSTRELTHPALSTNCKSDPPS